MGFVQAKEFNFDDKAKVLVHGNSGAGKTHLGATGIKPVIALCERQALRTIRLVNPEAAIWIIDRADDLRQLLTELKVMIAENRCPYDTVVLDSLTEIQAMLKNEILVAASRDQLTQGEWGVIIDKVANIARSFRDLPMHVLALCRSDEQFIDETRYVRPSLSGKKLPNDIAGFFNLVGYAYRKQDGDKLLYRVMFGGSDGFLVKGDPTLKPIEQPSWPDWIRAMYGPECVGASKAVPKTEADKKPEAKPAPKAEAKPAAKPEPKKPDAKPETKPEAKPEVKAQPTA